MKVMKCIENCICKVLFAVCSLFILIWGMIVAVLHLTNPIDVWNTGVEIIQEAYREVCEKLDED